MDPTSISFWSSSVPAAGAAYPARYDFATALDASNNLFVVAGLAAGTGASGSLNDAWMSNDAGASWTCQSCLIPGAPRFSPRYYPGLGVNSLGNLYLLGGTESGGPFVQELWNSTNQGASWNAMTLSGPWSVGASPFVLFDSKDGMWIVVPQGHLWFSPLVGGYTSFQDMGALSLGGASGAQGRTGFGLHLAANNVLFLAGGNNAGTGPTLSDVWSADLSNGAGTTVVFTQLTPAAGWSPRSHAVISEDSAGNLYVFGQFASPAGSPPTDLLWVSTPNGPAARGTNWTRVDSSSNSTTMPDCAREWPFPIVADPGDFTGAVDGFGRLVILSAGLTNAQPTGTRATAMIQLLATPANEQANQQAHLQQWTKCAVIPGESSSAGPAPVAESSTAVAPPVAASSTGSSPQPVAASSSAGPTPPVAASSSAPAPPPVPESSSAAPAPIAESSTGSPLPPPPADASSSTGGGAAPIVVESSSTGGGGGGIPVPDESPPAGLSPGATAAIVIVVLLFVGGLVAAYVFRASLRRLYDNCQEKLIAEKHDGALSDEEDSFGRRRSRPQVQRPPPTSMPVGSGYTEFRSYQH